jgi:uncharacterized membrane protein SpoIIM required for sporulation
MIADLKTFIERERPHWKELERELDRIREHLADLSDLKYARHVLGLFQRTSSDLARLQGSSAEPELKAYLENLVGSGYAEIHSATRDRRNFRPFRWLVRTFPQAFRRQVWGFWISLALTIVGALLGAILISKGVEGREAIYPFPHLVNQTPSERVAREERQQSRAHSENRDDMEGSKTVFSAMLMRNNISVTFRAMALGMTWGIGTLIILFYNGVILGAVAFDYIADGQTVFLLGWLLPHGSVEIPAILLGGQAGLILGRALIGWGTPDSLRTRFRKVTPDLATIAGGAALILVWAGIIEAFFSQYHEPVLPYWVKILFGSAQLVALAWFLFFSGKSKDGKDESAS